MNPKPLLKPRKELSKVQKDLMREHNKFHTNKHMTMMKKLMLAGFCFQQAHKISMQRVGK